MSSISSESTPTPVEVLVAFFQEMFVWEQTTYRRSHSTRNWAPEIEADLRAIFAKHCLAYDAERGLSCCFPPEYDIARTTILNVEWVEPSEVRITTKMLGPPVENVIFRLVNTAAGWKLAGKTIISSYSGQAIEGVL